MLLRLWMGEILTRNLETSVICETHACRSCFFRWCTCMVRTSCFFPLETVLLASNGCPASAESKICRHRQYSSTVSYCLYAYSTAALLDDIDHHREDRVVSYCTVARSGFQEWPTATGVRLFHFGMPSNRHCSISLGRLSLHSLHSSNNNRNNNNNNNNNNYRF